MIGEKRITLKEISEKEEIIATELLDDSAFFCDCGKKAKYSIDIFPSYDGIGFLCELDGECQTKLLE